MWIFLAFTVTITVAIYHLLTQNVHLKANVFMIYRGGSIVIMLLPFLFVNPILFSAKFYIMALLQAIIACYSDYLSFKVNQKCGAETVSSIIPFSVIIIFFMWCVINPPIVETYINSPLKTIGILLSFVGIICSLRQYYKVALSKEAIIKLMPVLVLSSLIAILNKLIMNEGNSHNVIKAVQLAWIVSFIVMIVHLFIFIYKKNKIKDLFTGEKIKAFPIFSLLLISIILRTLAIHYAQNPAYVSCLVYTSIVWVMIFEKHIKYFRFKYRDLQPAKIWKLLFVSSVIVLILCTN